MQKTNNPRVLWTCIPENLPIRAPTHVVTCAPMAVLEMTYKRHPSLQHLPLWHFAPPTSKRGASIPLQPRDGGGICEVWGEGALHWSRFREDDGGPSTRIDNGVDAAADLARWLAPLGLGGNPPVVWSLDADVESGALAIGVARELGSCVAVSTGHPDALTGAIALRHGVELRVISDARDLARAWEEFVGVRV
ncbi:MAG: hypothetical protein WCO19_01980 [Candidatus Saccharibacteria bacterium]